MLDPILSIVKVVGAYLFIFPLKKYFKEFLGRIPPDLTFKKLIKYHFPRSHICKRKLCVFFNSFQKRKS